MKNTYITIKYREGQEQTRAPIILGGFWKVESIRKFIKSTRWNDCKFIVVKYVENCKTVHEFAIENN